MKKIKLVTVLGVLLASCFLFTTTKATTTATVSERSPNLDKQAETNNPSLDVEFSRLEQKFTAKLGVYAIDTETNKAVTYNANSRFGYASTYKALAGILLVRDMTWQALNEKIMINKEDLVDYSPITENYVGIGLSLKEMISAAIQYSDNTAGNFLFKALDGPSGYQNKLVALDDNITNASRFEPDLNNLAPKDIRDTSTPRAVALNLKKLMLDNQLPEDKLMFIKKQMIENETGSQLIRAGVPSQVVVADKSGAANYGTRNDIAILYPPGRKPIVLVVFSNKFEEDSAYDNLLISSAAEIISHYFSL